MNTTQKTITVFNDLLTTQPNLFAQALPELVELEATVKALADNQEEEIAKAIRSFGKKQTAIRDVVMSRLGKDKGMTGIPTSRPTPEEDKILRKQLLNAMRRFTSSTPTSQPSKPNHEPTKPSR
ncbi:MAG: hypothetical protein BWK78_05700 [Thiotrichaceae bacterium IS1]|nr:MAG: hypothetical protein BWK78_05700 [Thiotrichaceae bacterium IS1]